MSGAVEMQIVLFLELNVRWKSEQIRVEVVHHNLLASPYEYWPESNAIETLFVLTVDHGPLQLLTLSWNRAPG